MSDKELMELRSYKIVKANDLIQKSRFNLQVQEQKIILYMLSKIMPEDMELKEHTFKIKEFCRVCGMDDDNGTNYSNIRNTLKDLRDKSMWITLDDGSETVLAWLDAVTIHKNSGKITVKISDMMKPYLLQLKERFTQYELLYTLAMKSQYSLRLYELLKSYEHQLGNIFDIEELKMRLSAEKYTRFPDFKRKVLDISMREINSLSDLNVSYTIIKDGHRFAKIVFVVKKRKEIAERLDTWANIDKILNPKSGGRG